MTKNHIVEQNKANGRAWIGIIQYEGFKEFMFGTVYVDEYAQTHEVEKEIYDCAFKCLPVGFKVVNMIKGSLVFLSDGK
jgi:hypothetical protein